MRASVVERRQADILGSQPCSQPNGRSRSSRRYPRLAHAFDNSLLASQEDRVVALQATKTLDCKSRIERLSDAGLGPRLVQLTQIREGGGEKEMRQRKSSVDLDRAAEPRDGLLIGANGQ